MLEGRDPDTERIRGLLEAARESEGGALLVCGEPGIGKSALLLGASAEARSAGMQVLVATGFEPELDLPFAGLAVLLSPLLDLIDEIPPVQADALEGAFALAPSRAADRFAILTAACSLLRAAGDRRPLLAIVDDVQWLDRSSSEAIRFAARRLSRTRVALLLARDSGEGDGEAWDGVEQLELAERVPAEASLPHLLTPRERAVCDLVVLGATNREAAESLFVSPRTVEHHLRQVYRKLELRSRTELAAAFARDERALSEP
jgi:DNA-binding CsgD family transcriptional regulator